MTNRQALRKLSTSIKALETFRELMKTESGRLTSAGVACIQVALDAGMRQVEIADLLEVDPSAVTYHKIKAATA